MCCGCLLDVECFCLLRAQFRRFYSTVAVVFRNVWWCVIQLWIVWVHMLFGVLVCYVPIGVLTTFCQRRLSVCILHAWRLVVGPVYCSRIRVVSVFATTYLCMRRALTSMLGVVGNCRPVCWARSRPFFINMVSCAIRVCMWRVDAIVLWCVVAVCCDKRVYWCPRPTAILCSIMHSLNRRFVWPT